MKWVKSADAFGWAQGHIGKGFLLHDGTVKTWNVDPFHPEDQHQVWERNRELSPVALNFEIDPDGGVVTEEPTVKVESIVQADPRLYDAGQRPVFEDAWDLQNFQPKTAPDNKPDFNFIMSGWVWDGPHRNQWTGRLCDCGWGPGMRRTSGVNKRRLLKAPDKAYRTPQGKRFLRYMKTFPDEFDSLLPYLGARFKKGDIRYTPPGEAPGQSAPRLDFQAGHRFNYDTDRDEPYWAPVLPNLPQWHQWYEARQHPTRRGVNILDPALTPQMLVSKVTEHQKALDEERQRANWLAEYGGKDPTHRFGPEAGKYKNWQIVSLDQHQAEGESQALGHCIGRSEHPYHGAIGRGDIRAFSLRDPEGYPHVSWHINPSGDSIGHMQGKSGEPNEGYRELISMFNNRRGLPDDEGDEEPLEGDEEEEEEYDPYVDLPSPTDVDTYVAQFNGEYDYPHDANIGPDTEINHGTPEWDDIARDYLRGYGDHDAFFGALRYDQYGRSEFARELERNLDADDMDERQLVSLYNSEGARGGEDWVDLPPLPANEVDKYNSIIDDGEDPQPTDYDELAQDYLKYPQHYGEIPENPPYKSWRNPYQNFHENVDAYGHQDDMHEALQENIDWSNPDHQLASQWWNDAMPQHQLFQQAETQVPAQIPGQMGWDWPPHDQWTAWHSPEPHPSTGPPNWDRTQYVVPNNSEYFPRASGSHLGAELHIGLAIPEHVAQEIHNWAKKQDWPEGTELEDPSEYHITLMYSPDGHEEHRDADWLDNTKGYDVEVAGVDEFGEGDGEAATVLRIKSPEVKEHADSLQDEAEDQGLEVSRFPGGYKPHITVAYGPGKPKRCSPPKLKFKTGPSSVSPPRESAWHFSDYQGWTNWETWNVKLIMDNEQPTYNASREVVRSGAGPQQFEQWALQAIIGPYNKERIQEAQEWNAIHPDERRRMMDERDRSEYGDAAVDLGRSLMDAGGFLNDPGEDDDAEIIDPNEVNWYEIYENIYQELVENNEYAQRQGEPAQQLPQLQPNPADQPGDTSFPQEWTSSWHFSVETPWGQDHDDWAAQRPAYDASGHQLGYDPAAHQEGKGFMLQDGSVWTWPTSQRRPMHLEYSYRVKRNGQAVAPGSAFHINQGGKYFQYGEGRALTPVQHQQIAEADPRLTYAPAEAVTMQGGGGHGTALLDRLREQGLDRESAWHWEQTPEILELPRLPRPPGQSYRADRRSSNRARRHSVRAAWHDPAHATALDSSSQEYPDTDGWSASHSPSRHSPDSRDSSHGHESSKGGLGGRSRQTLGPESRAGSAPDEALLHPDPSPEYTEAPHIIAPATELREWLADLGEAEPISPHHNSEDDFIQAPRPSTAPDLPYFPPANVPKEYKQSTNRSLYHGTLIDHLDSIRNHGLQPDVGGFTSDAYGLDENGNYVQDGETYGHDELGIRPAVYMTDKRDLGKAQTAMTAAIAQKLQKDYHDVTPEDIAQHGLLVKLKGGQEGYGPDETGLTQATEGSHGTEEQPHTAEPDDWFSEDVVGADQFITGPKILQVLQRQQSPPRPQGWSAEQGQAFDTKPYYDPAVTQERQFTSHRTADSPITQADASNDPLGKNPAIIPSRQGDPDYLEASNCPHCLQVHRPDEPCPDSSVNQYRQQERQWYNRDPNSQHSPHGPGAGPDGLHDQQMDLGSHWSAANPHPDDPEGGWEDDGGKLSSWDPLVCEHCNSPMTEPRQLGNQWINTCPNCKMTRQLPLNHPLLKQLQQQQALSPYPELLGEVGPRRPWNVFASQDW